ncbi:hypothetical protein LTS12_027423 [Elasticomyces elasticus]|nr:hypothetical protein LTS12_027423 [Elasticomyces elasticus]
MRSRDRWILSYEPSSKRKWEKIEVRAGALKFEVRFPNHEVGEAVYVENLRTLYHRCSNAAPCVHALDLGANEFPPTEAPSQAHTPTNTAIYIDDGYIKKGAFGEVRRAIKARDGRTYALKWFRPPDAPGREGKAARKGAKEAKIWNKAATQGGRKRKRDDDAYVKCSESLKEEYQLMKNNPHPNVISALDYQECHDGAFIVTPYHELGSLEDQDSSSINEDYCVKLLLQLLCCLHFLHGRGIIHRDIKPANILMEQDSKIVLCDFGLSKFAEDRLFDTFCGTLYTTAPEVFPSARASLSKYGSKVDIWSAAVVVAHLYQGKRMPRPPSDEPYKENGEREGQWHKWNEDWAQCLQQNLWNENDDDDQVINLLLCMLQSDPKKRLSAEQCLQKGCDNRLFKKLDGDHYIVMDEANNGEQASMQASLRNRAEQFLQQAETKAVSDLPRQVHAQSSASEQVTMLQASLPVQDVETHSPSFLSGSLWNHGVPPSHGQHDQNSRLSAHWQQATAEAA